MERKPINYWTKEKVFEEARKYSTKMAFRKGCIRAHDVAWKNGWFPEMTWFESGRKPKGFWEIKENTFNEAKKYSTKSEFKKNCPLVYKISCKNRWLDEMDWFVDGRAKMFTDKKDCVYKYYFKETNSIYIGRTIDKITRKIGHKKEGDTVFRYAKENGLELPQMEIIEDNITIEEGLEREDYWVNYYKEKGYNVLNKGKTGVGSGSLGAINCGKWTKEAVFKEARKYHTRSEFKRGCGRAYQIAKRNKWLDEMTWFVSPIKPSGYWKIKKNVIVESKNYKTRGEFQKGCIGAYVQARKNKWLDELFPKAA